MISRAVVFAVTAAAFPALGFVQSPAIPDVRAGVITGSLAIDGELDDPILATR